MSTRFRVRVEKLVYQGYGLARHDGKTLFVRRAAARDLAEVQVVQSKKSFDIAVIETLAEASPERADAPCPFFTLGCGGCQWQHIQYSCQLEWKRRIFLEFLERGCFERPFPPLRIHRCEPFHYRTRFQFHLTPSGRPALFREQSRELVAVDHCPLLPAPLNDLLARLQQKPWLAGCNSFQIWLDDKERLGLAASPPLPESSLDTVRSEIPELKLLHPASPDRMEYEIRNFRFLTGDESFFQTNRFLNETLNNTVCQLLDSGSRLLDLYSGVGFFSLPASPQFDRVVGVEENAAAGEQARGNARLNRVDNAEFVTAKVEDYLQGGAQTFDCILADPPRAGLSRRAVRWILDKKPARLIYVSCDPTTLVRDVQWLNASYRAQQFLLFDLFPQTFHFEVVAELRRK